MAYVNQDQTYTQDLTADNVNQLVDILFPYHDGEYPHRRKDLYDIKLKIDTGGGSVDVLVQTDNQSIPIFISGITTNGVEEVFLNVSDILGVCKQWQIRIIGVCPDFKLVSIQVDFELRPEPLTYIKVNLLDFGVVSPNKKRIRVWSFTLENLDTDEDISIVPIIDGVAKTAQTFNPTYPETIFYQFTEDEWGTDIALQIQSCCGFELYKIHTPVGVQILPVAKRFDQVGPEQFFRWGKIQLLVIRLIAFGGTSIPGTIYFEDNSKYTFTLTVADGKEGIYETMIPKTVAGQIVRVELGPTAFDFHRYYITAKVAKSGKDTENEWVQLDDNYSQGMGQ